MYHMSGNCARETSTAGGSALPVCTVERTTWGAHEVRIRGKMPQGWIGNLSSGMARSGVDILRGEAKKVAASFWEASFEVRPATGGGAPAEVDYLSLVRRGEVPTGVALSLAQVTMRPERVSGSLYVEITAKDQTGFLAELLNRLSFFSLFPEQMVIETRGDAVCDRFWLKSPGEKMPSDDIIAALKRRLDTLTVG